MSCQLEVDARVQLREPRDERRHLRVGAVRAGCHVVTGQRVLRLDRRGQDRPADPAACPEDHQRRDQEPNSPPPLPDIQRSPPSNDSRGPSDAPPVGVGRHPSRGGSMGAKTAYFRTERVSTVGLERVPADRSVTGGRLEVKRPSDPIDRARGPSERIEHRTLGMCVARSRIDRKAPRVIGARRARSSKLQPPHGTHGDAGVMAAQRVVDPFVGVRNPCVSQIEARRRAAEAARRPSLCAPG